MTRAVIAGGLGLMAAFASLLSAQGKTPVYGYTVVNSYPHDPQAFTQGLIFRDGVLFESTGVNGQSSLRKVKLETGEVLQRTELPASYFGEGLALVGERLVQLTWKQGVARIYEKATLKPLDQFDYKGEGWGLAYDGTSLIQSDGSNVLTYRDAETFAPRRRLALQPAE